MTSSHLSLVLSGAVMAIAFGSLLGYLFQIAWLLNWNVGSTQMALNTTICLLLLSAAMIIRDYHEHFD